MALVLVITKCNKTKPEQNQPQLETKTSTTLKTENKTLTTLVSQDNKTTNKNSLSNSSEKEEGEVITPTEHETKEAQEYPVNTYTTRLMEDVDNSNILLYEKTAFLSIEFAVRNSTSYSAGKDLYNITYISAAEEDDIYNKYIDYIDVIDEEFSNEHYRQIEGSVNELPIFLSVSKDNEESGESKKGTVVRLRISEYPDKFEDTNRYFDGYPDIVEIYKEIYAVPYHYELSYLESYVDNTKTYSISSATDAELSEFVAFYKDNYGDKDNYETEEDEYSIVMSWVDSELPVRVAKSKGNQTFGITIVGTLP